MIGKRSNRHLYLTNIVSRKIKESQSWETCFYAEFYNKLIQFCCQNIFNILVIVICFCSLCEKINL